MNRALDSLHRSFFQLSPFTSMGESLWNTEPPRVDVREDRRKVEVTAEVPGLSEQDIELTLSAAGDVLLLRGERRQESDSTDEDHGWHRSECYYGVVQRAIQLPCAAELNGAEAKLKDGVLRVKLKKHAESSEARHITVKAG